MKIIFRDNIKSYLMLFLLSIMAGLSVVLFCEFPDNELWALSYCSSKTFGFWIYIFVMFLITTIYKSFHLHFNEYTPFNSLIDLSLNSLYGWLLYSIFPAIICGILGAMLWSGRKNNIYGKILCVLPVIFIFFETILLFYSVFINHTKLFSAITDLICFILYIIFLKKEVFIKRNK